MDIKPYLGKSKTLDEWVRVCIENPDQGYWLIFHDTAENETLSLNMKMFPITGNTDELSDKEFLEFDASINSNGYCSFLNLDQLEDIISNLEMQKSNYTKEELIKAIEHYFSNDAFVEINNG